MKYIYPKLLFICLAVAIYCNNKTDKTKTVSNYPSQKGCRLILKRGAFHFDTFEIAKNKLSYITDVSMTKGYPEGYQNCSETLLDRTVALHFFKEIETRGFWQLKDYYTTDLSCTSQLIVTLVVDDTSKTVICDDFERDCPDLIKYIDQRVVELQGKNLKRIYLPG